MATLLICRMTGTRVEADLAANELELAQVGMLERFCDAAGQVTRWGLAQDYRSMERRGNERRHGLATFAGPDRRSDQRRNASDRRSRRK